jgi:pyridoxamine 5'-phosphate oxidase
MTKDQIIKFINENPVFALSTNDGTQPHVRYMMTSFADEENGITFCTGKEKDLYKQLSENPAVELCYISGDHGMQVRVTAAARSVEDLELKKATVEKFEFLKPWIEQQGYDAMAVYRLQNAKATVWTMETNKEAKAYVDL